jgi:membrane associated rhomboid family serine protease
MPIRITPAVKYLLIACVAMFILQNVVDQFMGGHMLAWLGLVPSGFVNQYRFWQSLTYPFLHGSIMHLFLNLLMLAFIAGDLEAAWGTRRFLQFYFFCAIWAGVAYLLLQFFVWGGLNSPMVGASGAIYGLLMAYGILFGERVLLFMLLFPMKAKHFVWILAGLEFMTTAFSGRGGLASAAHLTGMAAGFVYLWGYAWIRVASRRRKAGLGALSGKPKPKKRRKSDHLKLVINNEKDADLGEDSDHGPKTWH